MIFVRALVLVSIAWLPMTGLSQNRPLTTAGAATEDEKPAETSWQSYFRQVAGEYRVTLDGKEVWSVDLSKYDQFDSPYLCTTGEFLREPPAAAGQTKRKPLQP